MTSLLKNNINNILISLCLDLEWLFQTVCFGSLGERFFIVDLI
jgi:hypothetical protein